MKHYRQAAVRKIRPGRPHRPEPGPGRADLGYDVVNSLRAGIAVLDSEGVVRWTNQAWMSAETTISASNVALVGSNFLELAAVDARPFTAAIVGGITAVLAGATSYVELHSEADATGPLKLAITPLRGGRGGVVLHSESIGSRAAATDAPLMIDAARIAERMTPRELDVLTRMAAGLSNRAIAKDLGIEYTTVRGYVQSVLSKLGARSRVAAVARAYRSGLVRETES